MTIAPRTRDERIAARWIASTKMNSHQGGPSRSLSEIHQSIHVRTMELARRMRRDGPAHARLMTLAKTSRMYFQTLRSIGE
jgi:hypothetical protein